MKTPIRALIVFIVAVLALVLLVMIRPVGDEIPKVCAADAKVCPDGTSVGRNPDLDCEFNPCPERDCADEGETISGMLGSTEKCCEGLKPTTDIADLAVCINCGDGICRDYENAYDCPQDCEVVAFNGSGTSLQEKYDQAVETCMEETQMVAMDWHAAVEVCLQSYAVVEEYQTWCEEQGGYFDYIGLYPVKQCNLPASDFGKECTSDSQCESMCMPELTDDEYEMLRNGIAIENASGKCAQWKIVVGCMPYIVDGTVEGEICID
jgi:hypothetical protein